MARRDWYCEDVLKGRIEVKRIWEDERVLAFHNSTPESRVPALIIPKSHVYSMLDPLAADGDLLVSMVTAVQKVAMETGLDKVGFFVKTNIAHPDFTPHMHWHVRSLD